MDQIVEYTVITEKMLGSWLPKCNNLYDIIYQGIVIEYSVCACAFEMRYFPNTCMATKPHLGLLYTETWCPSYTDCTFGLCKIQAHTDIVESTVCWP